MPVEETHRPISMLVQQVSNGEIKLPEIQREFVWQPTQIAKLIDSLYHGYPSGSLLFWKTDTIPTTRATATNTPETTGVVNPLLLLDGQQRLTSLHRVFNNHAEAQIIFNIKTEKFQNQSAATRKDPHWIKVHDVLKDEAEPFQIHQDLMDTGVDVDSRTIGERLQQLVRIKECKYYLEVLTGFDYREITDIFVRVNSGGRPLKTSNLVMATLAARWPGVLAKLEAERDFWTERHFGDLDVTFLTRALAAAVLGRGLSKWSHSRLIDASDEELEAGWQTVRRGLRHLISLLKENLRITSSKLIPSMIALLPLIVYLGERPDEPLPRETRDGLLYWFLLAGIRNRYSSSSDTKLSQDIPAVREPDAAKQLLTSLGVVGNRIEVTPQDLAGKTKESAYFKLSFLAAKEAGAADWWFGTEISLTAEGPQRIEYHHIHPQATLNKPPNQYSKTEINDLANLAFISGRANRTISDRSPSVYFTDPAQPPLTDAELKAHFVPLDEELRDASTFRKFLTARRALLAQAMTDLLERFRPAWLDRSAVRAEASPGHSLSFSLYESSWDAGRFVVEALVEGRSWLATFTATDFEQALDAAASGLDSDLNIAGETVPVQVEDENITITIGPFSVVGVINEWQAVLEREKENSSPLSGMPTVEEEPWKEDRVEFPVIASE